MGYEATADAIARNIWEISTGNGARIGTDQWDSHRANCDAAVANTYRTGISVDDWQRAALARIEGKRTIDATPTWAGIMPVLIAVIENGTTEGRNNAVAEIMRLARAADSYIAADKANAKQRATGYQAVIWAQDRAGNPVTILLTEGRRTYSQRMSQRPKSRARRENIPSVGSAIVSHDPPAETRPHRQAPQ